MSTPTLQLVPGGEDETVPFYDEGLSVETAAALFNGGEIDLDLQGPWPRRVKVRRHAEEEWVKRFHEESDAESRKVQEELNEINQQQILKRVLPAIRATAIAWRFPIGLGCGRSFRR